MKQDALSALEKVVLPDLENVFGVGMTALIVTSARAQARVSLMGLAVDDYLKVVEAIAQDERVLAMWGVAGTQQILSRWRNAIQSTTGSQIVPSPEDLGRQEGACAGLIIVYLDGNLLSMTQAARSMLLRVAKGTDPSEQGLLAAAFGLELLPTPREFLARNLDVLVRERTVCAPQFTVFNVISSLARDGDGTPTAIASYLQDITLSVRLAQEVGELYRRIEERTRELEVANEVLRARDEELLKVNEELAKANRLKSEFLANMSHELRTPLGYIKGYTTTLLREDTKWTQKTVRKFLRVIDRASDRLDELIDNLLEMSKIEAGAFRVSPQPIQVTRLARKAVQEARARRTKHRFVLDFPPDFPKAEADPRRVQQVMFNLLDNAIKYSPPGSEIKVWGKAEDVRVVVGVADTGTGIPPEHCGKVFERFYRVEGSRKEGTGLGLAICRTIVEAHGGEMVVESEVGKGSCFWFTLPRNIRHERDSDAGRLLRSMAVGSGN